MLVGEQREQGEVGAAEAGSRACVERDVAPDGCGPGPWLWGRVGVAPSPGPSRASPWLHSSRSSWRLGAP